MLPISPRRARPCHRIGMSRLDTLCIVNLAILLCSLLLPILQRWREDSRELECKRKLSELTIATLDFFNLQERLPSVLCQTGCVPYGAWADDKSPLSQFKAQNSYWTQVMPYLPGYERLVRKLDPIINDSEKTLADYLGSDGRPVYNTFSEIEGYWDAAYSDCELFLCPSDDLADAVASPVFVIQPVSRLGKPGEPRDDHCGKGYFTFSTPSGKSAEMGRTNYGPAGGACSGGLNRGGVLGVYVGATGPREKRTLDEIVDGTSTTILHGETLGGIKPDLVTGIPVRSEVHLVIGGGLLRGRGNVPWQKKIGRAHV